MEGRRENIFAQKLVDYDPSVNNGNWAMDSFYRGQIPNLIFKDFFNPMLQSERFDSEANVYKKHGYLN